MPDEIWWPALCGNRTIQDAFWITNLTVNTPNPDVTRCFQNTVMIWVPSGCLWLMAPFYIKHLRGRETVRSTWASKSLLNIMKLIICLLLCLTDVLDLAKAIHEASWGQGPPVVFYIAPSVQLITFMLAGVFAHWEYKKGIHSSGPLFWFWSLVLVCSGVTMYSKIFNNHYQQLHRVIYLQSDSEEIFRFVVYCPHVLLVFIQWILTIIVDYKVFPPQKTRLSRANDVIGEKTPLLQKMGRKDDQPMLEESPEIRCSFLSNVTYFWYAKVLKMGLKKSLEFEDLNDILPRDKCQNILPTFTREWQKETEKCRRESKENKRNSQEDSGFVPTESQKEGKRKHRTPSLLKVMWRSLGWYLFLAAVYRFVCVFIILINPLLLRVLLNIIHDKNSQGWHGYVIAVMMCLSSEIHVIAIQRFCHHSMNLGLRLRTAVTAAVYRKALRLSSAAKRQTTVGQIVNMLAVDAQKLQDAPIDLQELWTLPLVCILTTLLLWDIVGPASISGVALLILFIVPVNGIYVANKIAKLQLVQMDKKDHRVKVTNEILSGIKVLKLYAWEPSFKAKVFGIREEELKYLKYANYLSAVSTVFFICSTYLATCLIFAVYVPLIGHNVLDASTAFVTMSLVNILSFPLSVLPFSVMFVAQCWVSVKRIRDFLLLEEVGADTVVYDHNAEYAAEIKNGTFSWGKDDYPLLNNMDMQVEPGSLVAIVGPVGSGKSSLVSALIGEMWKIGGKVTLNGSLAYVPQIAWIQNETVKGNILFGKPYNTDRYEEVLDACALKPDLAILAGGDLTEIGEKISVRTSNGAHLIFKAVHFVDFLSKLEGINLSGGQKQRVSLARAVYQDEDIYLLDDPLSAVDAHVGKHLFDQVIGPHGLLKSKTRILVTHSITYLPNVDQIFVMKNGHISERGSYEELISHNGAFAEFLRDYISDTLEESGEEKADLADIIGKLGTLIEDETEGDNIPDNKTDQLRLRRMKSRKGSSDGGTTFTPDRALSYTEQSEYAQLVTVEDEAEGTIKMSVLKKFFKATGWTAVVGAIFFHLLYLVAMVSTNIWLSMWTSDPVINGTRTDQERNYRLSVYGILTLGQVVMILIASMSLAIGSVYVSRTMHTDLIAGILRAPMSFFDTTPVGRIMNRVSKDMEGLDFNVPFLLRWWFNNVVRVLGTIVIIAYSTPIFMVAFVPLAAVYVLMQWVYTRTVRQLRRVDAVRRSPVFVHFDESIVGATSIRAYKQEERFTARCDQLIDESQRAWYYIILSMRWLGFVGESFGSIIMFFACLFAVMERDTIGSSLAGLSVSYSLQICVYLSLYVRCCTELETSLVSVERINEYSEVPTEAAWEVEGACPEQWPDEGNVQYDKYSTRYRPGLDYVLQGITVNIKPKEKVGVVGRTGAGKSSMALSLFRIIEAAEGKISVDGVDISQLGLSDLRSRITVIPQDPVIFSGTLRMNLDPFQRYSDDMLWDALAHAYLKNFVQTVPGGLSYECGENGEALSVGQRQLVCLARALLRKSKILVLDEATAGVDLETDSLIQDTIREAFKDCTILTIAHRLNTILDYDRVIVMDQGKIVEFDSPTRLIEDQSTIFYAMAKDANLV